MKEIANSMLKSNSKRFVKTYLLNVPKIEPKKLQAHEKLLIRDPITLKQKLRNLRKEGLSEIQIVTDFDFTWTYADINGNECDSTLGAIKASSSIPPRLKELLETQDKEFRDTVEGVSFKTTSHLGGYSYKFIHSAITRNVTNTFDALKNEKLTIKTLEAIMAGSLIVPRYNTNRFLKYCFERSVRLKFCSVGLTNMILPILKHWVDIESYQQLSFIANTLYFSPQDIVIDYHRPVIHRYSKASVILSFRGREKDLKNNLIIIGDRLSDAHMDKGMLKRNILKVGFCNDRDLLRLNDYCSLFDIVLVNGSFSLKLILLKYINGELKDSDLEDILSENTFDQWNLKQSLPVN